MTVEFIAIMLCLVVPAGGLLVYLYFTEIMEDKRLDKERRAREDALRKYRDAKAYWNYIWNLEHELLEDYAPVVHTERPLGILDICKTCETREALAIHDRYKYYKSLTKE